MTGPRAPLRRVRNCSVAEGDVAGTRLRERPPPVRREGESLGEKTTTSARTHDDVRRRGGGDTRHSAAAAEASAAASSRRAHARSPGGAMPTFDLGQAAVNHASYRPRGDARTIFAPAPVSALARTTSSGHRAVVRSGGEERHDGTRDEGTPIASRFRATARR